MKRGHMHSTPLALKEKGSTLHMSVNKICANGITNTTTRQLPSYHVNK